MKATPADLAWSARIDQALEEYPEMREYLDGIRGNVEALAARIKAVRNVHRRWNRGRQDSVCSHCYENTSPMPTPTPWPCPTIRAIDPPK